MRIFFPCIVWSSGTIPSKTKLQGNDNKLPPFHFVLSRFLGALARKCVARVEAVSSAFPEEGCCSALRPKAARVALSSRLRALGDKRRHWSEVRARFVPNTSCVATPCVADSSSQEVGYHSRHPATFFCAALHPRPLSFVLSPLEQRLRIRARVFRLCGAPLRFFLVRFAQRSPKPKWCM